MAVRKNVDVQRSWELRQLEFHRAMMRTVVAALDMDRLLKSPQAAGKTFPLDRRLINNVKIAVRIFRNLDDKISRF